MSNMRISRNSEFGATKIPAQVASLSREAPARGRDLGAEREHKRQDKNQD